MAWSKRHRVLLAATIFLGAASIVSVAIVIAFWRAKSKSDKTAVANVTFTLPPSSLPVISPAPFAVEEETSHPTHRPTEMRLETTYPLNTMEPAAVPTSNPSIVPSYAPFKVPSSLPTEQSTYHPTFLSTPWPTSASPTQAIAQNESESPSAVPLPVTIFYVIADVPYNEIEAAELPNQIQALPSDAEFLVHLGDIRQARGGGACKLYEYNDVATVLQQSAVPVFIVVGGKNVYDVNASKLLGSL
jgi:hypothetical protein